MEPAKQDPVMEKMVNLDRILHAEVELAPSSGFVESVMDLVREEAAAPQPIPFPWKRALPGMTIGAAGLAWCAVKLVQADVAEVRTPLLVRLHPAVFMSWPIESAGWVAAALGVSLLSWLLARRMVGRNGLL
jgi:hypothetical protein